MKRSRLHLDMFRVFCDLAQTQSFSKTAERNYVTQSAVSQQLTFLEKHFGQKLIDRGKNRFSLTEAGQSLLRGSQAILGAYQSVMDQAQKTIEPSGSVTVETVYSIGLHQLALYLKTFMRRYSKINLRVEYLRSDHIYDHVLHGTCDMGIVAFPRRHAALQIVPFKKEPLVIVCSPEDRLAGRKRLSIAELRDLDFIAFNKGVPTRQAIDEILRQHSVDVNIVQEFDNVETLKRSVEIGMGVSILSESTIAEEVKNQTLHAIRIAEGPFYRPTGILYRKDRTLSRAAKEFINWLTRE